MANFSLMELQKRRSPGTATPAHAQTARRVTSMPVQQNEPANPRPGGIDGFSLKDIPISPPAKRSSLPHDLKARIEQLSGFSMDDVSVHYNSARPAAIQARAYTQGAHIHIGPGQEQYLPHEAWHVVQQKQGRVQPTLRAPGITLNEDQGLEGEANTMGESASHAGDGEREQETRGSLVQKSAPGGSLAPIQGVFEIKNGALKGKYATAKSTQKVIEHLEGHDPPLKLGWKKHVRTMGNKNTSKVDFDETDDFIDHIKTEYPPRDPSEKEKRPNFSSTTYNLAKQGARINAGKKEADDFSLSALDLALPHRFPYKDIRDNLKKFPGTDKPDDLRRWSGRFIKATKQKKEENLASEHAGLLEDDYGDKVDQQIDNLESSLGHLIEQHEAGGDIRTARGDVVKQLNGLHGIVPDQGPHTTVNVPVSDRLHLHARRSRSRKKRASLSPASRAAIDTSPERMSKGVAVTSDGEHVVTVHGEYVPIKSFRGPIRKRLKSLPRSTTTLKTSNLTPMDLEPPPQQTTTTQTTAQQSASKQSAKQSGTSKKGGSQPTTTQQPASQSKTSNQSKLKKSTSAPALPKKKKSTTQQKKTATQQTTPSQPASQQSTKQPSIPKKSATQQHASKQPTILPPVVKTSTTKAGTSGQGAPKQSASKTKSPQTATLKPSASLQSIPQPKTPKPTSTPLVTSLPVVSAPQTTSQSNTSKKRPLSQGASSQGPSQKKQAKLPATTPPTVPPTQSVIPPKSKKRPLSQGAPGQGNQKKQAKLPVIPQPVQNKPASTAIQNSLATLTQHSGVQKPKIKKKKLAQQSTKQKTQQLVKKKKKVKKVS